MDREREEAMVIDNGSRKRKQEGGFSVVSPSLKKTYSFTEVKLIGRRCRLGPLLGLFLTVLQLHFRTSRL